MEVCIECHEKDKNVFKCPMPISDKSNHWQHDGPYSTTCDICGKERDDVYYCWYYSQYVNSLRGRK